jgi:tetratricopeptide (TPR) repeat protein
MYYFSIISIFLYITLSLTGCKKEDTEKTTVRDTINQFSSITQSVEVQTGEPIGDSTQIYGVGNFNYRDSLETYHRGYSIPRDSLYKVYNIKEFERFNFLIRRYPARPGPYLDRGNHFQNIKMYREAIADYNRYIELNPRNPSAYMNRGNAHERLKEYDSAMFDYNKTLELKPDDTIANFNKGNVYDILGKPDSAVMQYDTVIMKDPRLAKVYYNRGTSYMSMKNYSAAVKDWEEAIRLNPPYEPDLGPRINRIRALIK